MIKTRTILLFFALFVLSQALFSQEGELEISGVVLDFQDEVLPGVNVQIEGKKQGIITDMDGRFSLFLKKGSKVRFSFLGFAPYEMVVKQSNKKLRIVLKEQITELEQVVITGYAQTTKRRVTGSVATLSGSEIKERSTENMDMLLQGKVAGVDVKSVSGAPGASAKIRIRGTNTITGSAEPLWVVDGVVLQRDIPKVSSSQVKTGDFNDVFTNGISGINPNDISSITVLKDASAAAIYGSRAAGGVIVITTKKGEEGKMKINYSANLSVVNAPPRRANLMNSKEKLRWEQELWDEFSAAGFSQGEYFPVVGITGMVRSGKESFAGMSLAEQDAYLQRLGERTTDWFDELFRNSVSNSHFLSLSGGGAKSTYYLSLGYSNNKGLLKKTDYTRYNINAKIEMKPHERVSLGFITDLSFQDSNSPSLSVNPFRYAYFANPYERAYDDQGNYAADNTYFMLRRINDGYPTRLPSGGYNIFREINETSSNTNNFSITTIGNLSVKLLKSLRFEGLASYGYTANNVDNINGSSTYAAWQDRPFEGASSTLSKRTYGSITQSSAYNLNYNLRGQLNFSKELSNLHYFNILTGTEIRGQFAKSTFQKRYGYDPDSGNSSMPVYPNSGTLGYNDLISYAAIMDGLSGQNIVRDAFASFYSSLSYVYNQKYILNATARTDGSNNFGSKEQFNPTGSIGLSWNVDQERFMRPLEHIISSLSLRVAGGYTGNINKSVYPQLVMDYETTFRKTTNNYYRKGSLRNAPNPHLRWERTRDVKGSVDIGFLKERIRLQVEVYDRRSRDVVTGVRVPSTTGFTTQSYNTSELLNQGVEFNLSSTIIKKRDWSLRASTNLAYNRNKLLKYTSPTGSIYGGNYVGYPLSSLFSGKYKGIDKGFGIYVFEKRPDTVFETADDRKKGENYLYYIGTSNAPLNGGYSINASFKRISVNVGGSYSYGGKIKNNIVPPDSHSSVDRSGRDKEPIPTQNNDLYVNHLNVPKTVVNRWTEQNPITTHYPRLMDHYGKRLFLDDYMVTSTYITDAALFEDLSFFKIRSVSLAYSFEEQLLKRIGVDALSVSFSVNNIAIFSKYSGIDPETPGAVYPIPRTFSMGINVGF